MAKFKKGQSGNPSGRPIGALNKSTKEIKDLLAEMVDFEGLVKKLEERALWGNERTAELLLAYRWGRPIQRDAISVDQALFDNPEGREELMRRAERAIQGLLTESSKAQSSG